MTRRIDLMTTLQDVRVPSFVVDAAGTITWLNAAAVEAFGDLEGSAFSRLIPPDRVDEVQRQLQRKLERKVSVTDYGTEVLMRDGQRRRAEISSVAIEGGDRCHAVFGVALLHAPRPAASGTGTLTRRQREVLRLIADGESTSQIAEALHISDETVRNHVRHILRRLGVHSRVEAVAAAYRDGLL